MREQTKNTALIGWMVCLLGAVYYIYEYLLRIAPSVMESSLRYHFHMDATSFGTLSAVYYFAYVPMQLPVGVLIDRYGPRRLLTVACALCVVGTYLFANTDSIYMASIGRFLVGFGSAFAFVGVLKLATIWLPEDRLGMVSGLTAGLGTIGAIFGDNVLVLFVSDAQWQTSLNIAAVFGILLCVILWVFIRDCFSDIDHVPADAGTANFTQGLKDLYLIISNRQIWFIGAYGCLVYLPTTVIAELWGIPYLQTAHGLSKEAASLVNSFTFFGFLCGAPVMGWISDKIHRRKLPMQIGALGAFVILMVIIYLPGLSKTSLCMLMSMLGLFYSSQALVFATAREVSPHEAGATAMATTNMLVMLGGLLMQPLIGRLLDYSEQITRGSQAIIETGEKQLALYTAADYQFAMAIIPISMVLAYLATFYIRETYAVSE